MLYHRITYLWSTHTYHDFYFSAEPHTLKLSQLIIVTSWISGGFFLAAPPAIFYFIKQSFWKIRLKNPPAKIFFKYWKYFKYFRNILKYFPCEYFKRGSQVAIISWNKLGVKKKLFQDCCTSIELHVVQMCMK